MQNELTNLLPQERQQALSRAYVLRICVVVAAAITTLIVIAGVLLVPTYLFLTGSANAKEERLANIKSGLTSADETKLSARLTALSKNIDFLTSTSKARSISSIIQTILDVPHPNIALLGFSYNPPKEKSSFKTLTISGLAVSRDALRTYQLALQNVPFARSADLPISVYAEDTDITFTITVTLTP